jgi:beta-phosphoglucomutase-like phosphatase (HAD superfamily)
MLDMGGMPSAASDQSSIRAVGASKNSKLQAIAFDFDVLTRSLEEAEKEQQQQQQQQETKKDISATPETLAPVQPDLDRIQQLASLLGVSVETGTPSTTTTLAAATTKPSNRLLKKTQPHEDVRAKYAKKLQGGLAGIELAKSKVEDSSKGGDAAGHLAARQMATHEKAVSPTKWMAMTGTGRLLSFLTHRSIQIALLPNPRETDGPKQEAQQTAMQTLTKQLKGVVFDCILALDSQKSLDQTLQTGVLDELGLHANRVLVVSDRDEYLKAARDLGMITCRLQRKNTRRGDITALYNVASIPDVQELVNDINGISFNTVLNR